MGNLQSGFGPPRRSLPGGRRGAFCRAVVEDNSKVECSVFFILLLLGVPLLVGPCTVNTQLLLSRSVRIAPFYRARWAAIDSACGMLLLDESMRLIQIPLRFILG